MLEQLPSTSQYAESAYIELWLYVCHDSLNEQHVLTFRKSSKQTLILGAPGGVIGALATLALGWLSDKRVREGKASPVSSTLNSCFATERKDGAYCHINHPNYRRCSYAHRPQWIGREGCTVIRCVLGCGPTDYLAAEIAKATWIIGFFGSSLALVYAYNASNTSGHSKKVTVNAMTLATFGLGNIIGTEIFAPKDSPDFIPGKITILVLLTAQLFICFLIRYINLRLNKKKRALIESLKTQNNWSDEDIQRERERHAFLDLTDKQ